MDDIGSPQHVVLIFERQWEPQKSLAPRRFVWIFPGLASVASNILNSRGFSSVSFWESCLRHVGVRSAKEAAMRAAGSPRPVGGGPVPGGGDTTSTLGVDRAPVSPEIHT